MQESAPAKMSAPSRPGVVTLVGIVLYINALLAAIASISLFINREDSTWNAVYGTTDEVTTLAVVEAVLAVLLFAVASGVMSGAKWARLAVAIVIGLRLAALTWFMLAHLGGGAFTWTTTISLAIGLFVLWALYGKDESIRFYEGYA